jgi:hypothetical protein
MNDLNKKRLLYGGCLLSIILMTIGPVAGRFLIQAEYHPGFLSVGFGMLGLLLCIGLMIQVEKKMPRQTPTHQLKPELARPPSFERVTLPTASELWRSTLVIIAVWIIFFSGLFWWLSLQTWWITPTAMPPWLPWLIPGALLIYIHESIRGPHRRLFWIGHIIGEWRGQPWQGGASGIVQYLCSNVDVADSPPQQRLYSFLGRIPIRHWYWAEILVRREKVSVISYVPVPKELFAQLTRDTVIPVRYRLSRLDPNRLQVKLNLSD